MKFTILILFIFLYSPIGISQVPKIEIEFLDYEDYENDNYQDLKNIKRIIQKSNYFRNEKWQEFVKIIEFNKNGKIIKVQKGKVDSNNVVIKSTITYEYNKHGLWEYKIIGKKKITREFSYNKKGELVEIKYSTGGKRNYCYDKQSRIIKAQFSKTNWNEYEYLDSINQIKRVTIFQDSIFFEQKNYKLKINSYEIETKSVYKHNAKDTIYRYDYFFYNNTQNLICYEQKEEFSNGWEILTMNFRYKDNLLVETTDFLSIQKTSGYKFNFYNRKKELIKIETFIQNGISKTCEYNFEYEYY